MCITLFTTFIIIYLIYKVINHRFFTKKCTSTKLLHGKTVILTGCTSGIGLVTARELARRGARLIMACRNVPLAENTRNEIVRETGNKNIIVRHLDLEELSSVREFSKIIHQTEPRIDILINNAGYGGCGGKKTVDGLNVVMQVNHFAPFLLTILLTDLLKKSSPSRIVNVSSLGHLFALFKLKNINQHRKLLSLDFLDYTNAKFCNLLTSNELARRLQNTGVTVNSLHPGNIYTNIGRNMRPIFQANSVEEGAQTTLHVALSEELEGITGKYFANCQVEWMKRPEVDNQQLAEKVWTVSESLVKLNEFEKSQI